MRLRVAIIDDEFDARELNRTLLESYCQPVDILWEAVGITDGLMKLRNQPPDLLLLDVQLKDGSGFQLLDQLDSESKIAVVFITAYDQYAVQAFRYAAADYLLKPIEPGILSETIDRYRHQHSTRHLESQLRQLVDTMLHGKKAEQIIINTDEGHHIVKYKDLIRLEASEGYTWIFTTTQRILSSKKIGEYEDLLPNQNFYRTHQSHIINLDFVHMVQRHDPGEVIMTNGDHVEVSRRQRQGLLESLSHLGGN